MPKRVIPNHPYEMQAERINRVVIGWSKGDGAIQIGVQEPDAMPGEREGGHFVTIGREQIGQLIAALRTAERQAYKA